MGGFANRNLCFMYVMFCADIVRGSSPLLICGAAVSATHHYLLCRGHGYPLPQISRMIQGLSRRYCDNEITLGISSLLPLSISLNWYVYAAVTVRLRSVGPIIYGAFRVTGLLICAWCVMMVLYCFRNYYMLGWHASQLILPAQPRMQLFP